MAQCSTSKMNSPPKAIQRTENGPKWTQKPCPRSKKKFVTENAVNVDNGVQSAQDVECANGKEPTEQELDFTVHKYEIDECIPPQPVLMETESSGDSAGTDVVSIFKEFGTILLDFLLVFFFISE